MRTEAEKVDAAGFMDDEAGQVEKTGPQSVSIPHGDVIGVLANLSREPIQQPASVKADPYGRVTEGSGLPIVAEGRGGKDSLREAATIALRARNHTEKPPDPVREVIQEASAPSLPIRSGRRIMKKVGKPQRRIRESKSGSVQVGDVVEHKKYGCLGTVVEASRQGMVVNLAEVGIVEVTRETAPLYALVAKGVISE